MNYSFLENAKACAYYVDGFGVGIKWFAKGWFESTEQSMWYYLLLAAEAGEI